MMEKEYKLVIVAFITVISAAISIAALLDSMPPSEAVAVSETFAEASFDETGATSIKSESDSEPEIPDGYVLRAVDGYIAVYNSTADERPAMYTDIEIATLPLVDRKMLSDGIVVETREELMQLLEDFGS